MLVLGIETSCDETAAAIVEDGKAVRSNVIATSKHAFTALAGVIPEEAARKQAECMAPVVSKALQDAGCRPADLDAIAVTKGPGLLGSLLVGTAFARSVAAAWGVRLLGVHHTLGHLSSTWLDAVGEPRFPVLTLSASGGHTDLWHRKSHLHGTLVGRTQDDAAGEAFDKGASMLGLPYPGGPSISKEATGGDPRAFPFPLPLRGTPGFSFSFSGLKTALKYTLRDNPEVLADAMRKKDLVASYQHALCAHLTERLERAIDAYPDIKEVHLVGGVSANAELRTMTAGLCAKKGLLLRVPRSLSYCTDNAAMIAAAGEFLLLEEPSLAGAFATAASLPLEETVLP